LEIEKRGKFKTYSYELASIDVFERDDGLVFQIWMNSSLLSSSKIHPYMEEVREEG